MVNQLTNNDYELTVYLNRYNRWGMLRYGNVRQSVNLKTGEITTLDRIGKTTKNKHDAFETYQAIQNAVNRFFVASKS